MSRLIDVVCVVDDYQSGIENGKLLVQEHLVCVSYIMRMKTFFNNEDGEITERDMAMLIMKSKDTIFQKKLIPRFKQLSCLESVALPIVDSAADYRLWINNEVYE